MPSLTGPQCKQLVDIIVKCFDEGSLERMLFFHLEVHLNTIAGNGPFEEVTFKVVNWSEAQGRTPELLTALKEERPQKTELVEVVTKLRAALGVIVPPKPPDLSSDEAIAKYKESISAEWAKHWEEKETPHEYKRS